MNPLLLALVSLATGPARIPVSDTGWVGAPNPRLDSIFSAVNRPDGPGCAVEILRHGSVVYSRGYGLASVELGVPLSPQTVFDVGSISKQFTAMAILLLRRDGRLSLDDDVRKYVPELPAYGTPIRLRHLLTQTSGLRDYVDLFPMAGIQWEAVVSPSDALNLLARQRSVSFRAGNSWAYSNTNYFLLALVVQRVSGESYGKFLAERIFTPLGMTSTYVMSHHDQVIPHRATGYAPSDSGPAGAYFHWETMGDGSVQSTLGDLAAWTENYFDPVVGDAEIVREMQTSATLTNGVKTHYGFGLAIRTLRGQTVIGHNGGTAGFYADIEWFPDPRLTVLTACNTTAFVPFTVFSRVASVLIADRLDPPMNNPDTVSDPGARKDLAMHAGRYFSEATGLTRDLVEHDGVMTLLGYGPPRAMVLAGPDRLRAQAFPIDVVLHHAPDGRRGNIDEIVAAGPVTSYLPVPDSVALTAAQEAAYVGSYRSAELETTWHIRVGGGHVILRQSGLDAKDDTLSETFPDGFNGNIGPLRFVRDTRGQVTGVEVWTRSIRALLLSRMR